MITALLSAAFAAISGLLIGSYCNSVRVGFAVFLAIEAIAFCFDDIRGTVTIKDSKER